MLWGCYEEIVPAKTCQKKKHFAFIKWTLYMLLNHIIVDSISISLYLMLVISANMISYFYPEDDNTYYFPLPVNKSTCYQRNNLTIHFTTRITLLYLAELLPGGRVCITAIYILQHIFISSYTIFHGNTYVYWYCRWCNPYGKI